MSDRFPEQMLQAGDNNLDPIAGAKLNFYITGTTTRKDTYSDDAKTIANVNPVVADAAGRFGDIFMDTDVAYKVVYTDASDVVIQTFDPFDPVRATNVVETPVVTKSSNFTVLESERGSLYEIDASAGSVNATLLAAATAGNNFEIGFKKVDSSANAVTVDGNGAETIDGAVDQTLANQYDVIVVVSDGTTWHIKSDNRSTDAPLPRGYESGMQLKVDGTDAEHDTIITEGVVRDEDDGVNIELDTFLIKQIDASWAPGDNQGGLSSSLTLTADTWYHFFAIVVGGSADAGYDTEINAANLVADHGATAYRWRGAVKTNSSSNIIAYTQREDWFEWNDPPLDIDVTQDSASNTRTLPGVPPNVVCQAECHVFCERSAANVAVHLSALTQDDEVISDTAAPLAAVGAESAGGSSTSANGVARVFTDTSQQIRTRAKNNTTTMRISVHRWRPFFD